MQYTVQIINRGRTIRKVKGEGRAKYKKKKFMQGKIKWKKIHACRVDQEKNSCIGLPHILHKS